MIAGWIKTLLFPVLNIIAILVFCVLSLSSSLLFVVVFLLCSALPGIIPLVLIFRFKLDLSEYFLKQIIFTMVSGFFCVVSWAFAFTEIPLIAPPAFLLIYFIINWRTLGDTRLAFIEDKLAVAASCLSSPLVLYMEFLIVFLLALAYHR